MKKIVFVLVVMTAGLLSAQQEALVSQFMYNGVLFNPAVAGSENYWNASATYRKQWLGFDGTPSTQLISIQGPWKDKNVGWGGSVCNDIIGISKRLDADLYYSYHLKTGSGKLGMGLRAGISHYSAQLSELTVWDAGDSHFSTDVSGKIIPNAGAGFYYFHEFFNAGVSIPNLISHKPQTPISISLEEILQYQRHLYIHASGKIKAGEKFFIKPAALFRYVKGAPAQAEIHLAGSFKDMADLGVSYRSGDGLVFITQMNIMKQLRLGYSFDLPLSDLQGYSNGTHEIRLTWLFGKGAAAISAPSFLGN